jgi:hypothetical protein
MVISRPADLSADELLLAGNPAFLLTGDDTNVRRYAVELYTRYRILLTAFHEVCREVDAADARERSRS